MEAQTMLSGMIAGFSIAAPVGPIGVLCIRRSLSGGMPCGFASGLGAATADAFYGCVAGFGLTAVPDFLTGGQTWLGIIGGLFLCYLGISTFRSRPAESAGEAGGAGLLGAYASTFFLTLVNPMTIISFALVFAGLGAGAPGRGYSSAGMMVTGVFLGSVLWWLVLSGSVSLLRSRFSTRGLIWVNRSAGSVLLAFGIVLLIGKIYP